MTVDVASMAGDRVEVSRNLFHPCPALAAQLSAMNIMLQCTDNGKRFYMLVIQLVGQHLKSGCIDCSNELCRIIKLIDVYLLKWSPSYIIIVTV